MFAFTGDIDLSPSGPFWQAGFQRSSPERYYYYLEEVKISLRGTVTPSKNQNKIFGRYLLTSKKLPLRYKLGLYSVFISSSPKNFS